MSLTLRPPGLGSPVDKDGSDYTVFSGKFAVGRIEERGAPADHHIFGTPPDMQMDGRAPTLESKKAQLGENWRKWLGMGKADRDRRLFAHP